MGKTGTVKARTGQARTVAGKIAKAGRLEASGISVPGRPPKVSGSSAPRRVPNVSRVTAPRRPSRVSQVSAPVRPPELFRVLSLSKNATCLSIVRLE